MHNNFKYSILASVVALGLGMNSNAAAEAEVYGKLHVSVASVSQDDGTDDTSATAISSHASRLGVKAKQALDNGMEISGKAEFELDSVSGSYSKSYDVDGDGSTDAKDTYIFKARNMYVGLKGGFGEMRVGRHDTPHKISTKKLDPFGDTYADYNNIITWDNRLSDVVAYMNQFGQVGFAAAYYAGEDDVDGENEGDGTSAMLNYDGGPLYLSAAMESLNDVADGDEESATKLGIGYTFGAATVGFVHETIAFAGDVDDHTEMYASLQYKLSDKVKLKAAYGSRDDDVSATDDEVMSAVGLDYKLDKSATVYGLYANGTDGGLSHKGKLDGDGTALALGLVYKF